MKKTILTICAVIGVLCFANLASARVNTIASATMVFKGTLSESNGIYTGTVAMINEATDTAYGDGESGFDVYAKNGAWATFYKDSQTGYTEGQVVDNPPTTSHDAYTQAGGWGATYDPDCADWYNYQLTLTSDHWYLEYNSNVGNDGDTSGAAADPMSGTMDWGTLFATETGTGAYYTGQGPSQDPGYAANFATNHNQSTVGAWDMDWSWGSDYAPLQLPGFDVSIYPSDSEYYVVMTPAPEPATIGLLLTGLVGLLRRRKHS